jgi:hypothetical protein
VNGKKVTGAQGFQLYIHAGGKSKRILSHKYFSLRNSVDFKILESVTLRLDKCYQAAVLIFPWNVICH